MTPPQTRGRPATIVEVAKLAGVSFKSVSRVVNNEAVRPATRNAVLAAMQMLNYVPNLSARQLAGHRSNLVALLLRFSPATPNEYLAAIQAGALKRCRERGYTLIVEEALPGVEDQLAMRLQALRVDGVILTPPLSRDKAMIVALARRGLRYALISPEEPDDLAPSVQVDDRHAARQMAERLIELGHRDIGFIGASWPAGRRRAAGFFEALAIAGLTRRAELEADGDFTFEGGEKAAERILAAARRPTAIFAANDAMALGAMFLAARMGIRVPAELSVAGFDDNPSASFVWPPLTTIRQPLEEMSAAALDLLLDAGAELRPDALMLDFTLVERGSTAPAP